MYIDYIKCVIHFILYTIELVIDVYNNRISDRTS